MQQQVLEIPESELADLYGMQSLGILARISRASSNVEDESLGVTIATSLAEATAALAAIPTATVIAGGTDRMVGIDEGPCGLITSST